MPSSLAELTVGRWMLGAALITSGVVVMAMSIRSFSHAGTPVPSNQPVRVLVTTGPHARSRNPIYVGMGLLYAGTAVAASSLWSLVLALPLVVFLHSVVVAREERYLDARFGESYRDYRRRVRRWL